MAEMAGGGIGVVEPGSHLGRDSRVHVDVPAAVLDTQTLGVGVILDALDV